MTTLTIVQARTGSARLPGKVLATVGEHTILEWVLHRLALTDADLGRVVVATSARAADNAIADLCVMLDVPCYRSSEHDVLNRFYRTAVHHQAVHEEDTIARVTADCPLLCPELLAATVTMQQRCALDYVGVHGAPNGLGQEALRFGALEEAWHDADLPHDREHVITFVDRQPARFKVNYVEADEWTAEREHWRLTLDEPDDLDLLRRLYAATGGELFDLDSRAVLTAVEADAESLALATRRP